MQPNPGNMNLSYLKSEIPKSLWLEFERRYEGNDLLDTHETLIREIESLIDIAREHHSLVISPHRLRPHPDYSGYLTPALEVDPGLVLPALQHEICQLEQLSESLRTIIMSSKQEAQTILDQLWPKNEPRNSGKRRRGKQEMTLDEVIRRYEGRKREYESHFEGRERVEKLLEMRWKAVKEM